MFIPFFFFLRSYGLPVSIDEWLLLIKALEKGLHGSTLWGFYTLCKAVLIKSETEFDRFDQAFQAYFGEGAEQKKNITDFYKWLEKNEKPNEDFDKERAEENSYLPEWEIEKMLRERMEEQTEEHNGGSYWIGTGGVSVFGNDGFGPRGIRIMGSKDKQQAFHVMGERRYRDFREDQTLSMRNVQVAIRRLRQFTNNSDTSELEFDVEGTIRDTCKQGGLLKVTYKKPRKNAIKLLLLMDSGGSMEYYSIICSTLFHALNQSNQFHDLKIYYFHNCITSRLYTDPRLKSNSAILTKSILSNLSKDYRVIIVGDGRMNPVELFQGLDFRDTASGLDWFLRFKKRYPHIVWINPAKRPDFGEEWAVSYDEIEKHFQMHALSVEGLSTAIKELLVKR